MGQDPAPVLPAAGLVARGHRARPDAKPFITDPFQIQLAE